MTMQAAASSSPTVSLASLIRRGAGHRSIAAHLDSLAPFARLEEMLSITGSMVGQLYDAVAGAPALTVEDIVPTEEKSTLILEGRNSLPAFTRFQKRFARVGDVIVGYNHQTMAPVTGPGFFLVRGATAGEAVEDEPFFDYTGEIPTSGLPAGWPAYKPNDRLLSRAVYMNMKDFCRRVANGVLVGKAYKLGKAQNAFFTLTRSL